MCMYKYIYIYIYWEREMWKVALKNKTSWITKFHSCTKEKLKSKTAAMLRQEIQEATESGASSPLKSPRKHQSKRPLEKATKVAQTRWMPLHWQCWVLHLQVQSEDLFLTWAWSSRNVTSKRFAWEAGPRSELFSFHPTIVSPPVPERLIRGVDDSVRRLGQCVVGKASTIDRGAWV